MVVEKPKEGGGVNRVRMKVSRGFVVIGGGGREVESRGGFSRILKKERKKDRTKT
jgi:hypothetical protein